MPQSKKIRRLSMHQNSSEKFRIFALSRNLEVMATSSDSAIFREKNKTVRIYTLKEVEDESSDKYRD